MKQSMLRTILVLIATLIALPVVAFYYDQPLNPEQWNAVKTLFRAMLAIALLCFAVSEITRNYSQVDKLWSLLPIGYAWYVATQAGFDVDCGFASAWASALFPPLHMRLSSRGDITGNVVRPVASIAWIYGTHSSQDEPQPVVSRSASNPSDSSAAMSRSSSNWICRHTQRSIGMSVPHVVRGDSTILQHLSTPGTPIWNVPRIVFRAQ